MLSPFAPLIVIAQHHADPRWWPYTVEIEPLTLRNPL